MKYIAIFIALVLLMLISCTHKEQTCTNETIMAFMKQDTSAARYVDGICLDESRVAILRQVRSTIGGGDVVVELGFFDSIYHFNRSFNAEFSRGDIVNSIAFKDSILYIAASSYLYTIDMKGNNSKLLAKIQLSTLSFSIDSCFQSISKTIYWLFPVEMNLRNDSIILDVGELDYPKSPLLGHLILDEDMHPSAFTPDSVCVEINFPDGRNFSHGACTKESWLRIHRLKELPVDNLFDPCKEITYDGAKDNTLSDTIARRKTPEEYDSIIKFIVKKWNLK